MLKIRKPDTPTSKISKLANINRNVPTDSGVIMIPPTFTIDIVPVEIALFTSGTGLFISPLGPDMTLEPTA